MPSGATSAELLGDAHLEELLRWLALGGHHLELPQLAEIMGQPVWKLEAECDARRRDSVKNFLVALTEEVLARRLAEQAHAGIR